MYQRFLNKKHCSLGEDNSTKKLQYCICTVPEEKVVISNFLKLEVYGNCDACMCHANTICSNLHAYVDIDYFFIGNLFNLRIFDNFRLMYIILCILTICLGAFEPKSP